LIKQTSRIKVRSGIYEHLPILDKGEMGWAVDVQRLFIGNGTYTEGAPTEGNTEIYTATSFTSTLASTAPSAGTPSGTKNGTNKIFTLPVVPFEDTLIVWCNYPLIPGVGYTISGSNITFTKAPQTADTIYYQCLYSV
jgi:hypothetical protein